jgi:hypothetical protein
MVLVSKLFGSSASRQTNSTSSLFGKLRSNICRSSSNSCIVKFSAVEKFVGETCDSPVSKKNLSPMWHDDPVCKKNLSPVWHDDDVVNLPDESVNLSDFSYGHAPNNIDETTQSRRWLAMPSSFCASHCDDEPDRPHRMNAAYLSPARTRPYCPAIQITSAIQIGSEVDDVPGTPICDALVLDAPRLPGGLGSCEQSETPPQVQSAWGCSKEEPAPGSRMRVPSRLPPLSRTDSKSLRSLGSNTDHSPVVEICDMAA